MGTTARLGIDITATDKSRAAFASTLRSMDALNKSVGMMRNALAGLAGGNLLTSFTRSMVSINREVPAVKQALERMNASYTKFGQTVGSAGLNNALVNFSNRIGGMIAGNNGLADSVGRLLGSGINGLTLLFEGIGRSLAFVSDNMGIFSRAAGVFLAYKLGQQVAWTGMAFLKFAAAVRASTTVMAAFSVVTSIGKRGLVGLAVAGALIATTFEDVERYVDSLTKSIANAMGPIGENIRKTLQALGFDTSALNSELAGMVAFGSGIENSMGKSEKALKTFGRSVKVLDGDMKQLKNTTADQAFQSIQLSLGSLSGSLVQVAQGTTTLKEAFSSTINSLIQDLTRLFVNQAFQSFLGLFAARPLAVGVAPGTNGLGFLNFGGPRAAGGPVSPGKAYLVGEKGPEIFAPGRSGSIIPPRGGGKVEVNVFNNNGSQVRTKERTDPNGARRLEIYIEDMVAKTLGGRKGQAVMGAVYGVRPPLTSR